MNAGICDMTWKRSVQGGRNFFHSEPCETLSEDAILLLDIHDLMLTWDMNIVSCHKICANKGSIELFFPLYIPFCISSELFSQSNFYILPSMYQQETLNHLLRS